MSAEELEKPEAMAAFFNARAAGYDAHMRDNVFPGAAFVQFYEALSAPIESTGDPLTILDLGCGTGLEIEVLLRRAPNALITGVDVSREMLARLRKRYSAHMHQITLVTGSYLTMPFGAHVYDYILSAMTIHHLLHNAKRTLYRKIYAALKPGGKYIEGDSVTPAEMEGQFLAEYSNSMEGMPPAGDGYYHIDVPLSLDTQRSLLREAGFKSFEVVWQEESDPVWHTAVYVVTK
jgi:tRNA (cmo5U34)-methyltransferase